jgi:hypothetical protein
MTMPTAVVFVISTMPIPWGAFMVQALPGDRIAFTGPHGMLTKPIGANRKTGRPKSGKRFFDSK